ncbi:hypothetical protein BN1723_000452 [Verticillium longisporum]|uniref:Uncharacterized protein n=1 Tax=Verticillium longisporum TaxID=100787 RepID=A0A0G4M5K8_VERLO|nr:hypothetical protein BN1723_000452 [Verticillium longisporum]
MSPNTEPMDAGPITRRLIILFRLWKPSPSLMSVFNIYIKVKPFASLAEAKAMRFIARYTSVPVLKVYCAFIYKGDTYTIMSKMEGKMA